MKVGPEAFAEDRYHRQSLVTWWDQERVRSARVLVAGAGALGNEILKTLALMGAGHVLVYDMDTIERSNLSRGVLFRDGDEGGRKAEVAVRRMRELNPDVAAHARVENMVHRAGLGVFLWADIVISGVDNREARVFVNAACAATGRAWVDGAIEGFSGVVRAFQPRDGPCYECTMSAVDRKLVAERRSCALLAVEAQALGRVPATATAASVVAALEVQEAMKILHGQPALIGEGLHIDGFLAETSRVRYPRREECPGHEFLGDVTPLGLGVEDTTIGDLLARAEGDLGPGAVLEFSRDVIVSLECPSCGGRERIGAALGEVGERQAKCPSCGEHRIVETASGCGREGPPDPSSSPGKLGIPPLDIMVARQGMAMRRAYLFDADADRVLGPLAASCPWRDVVGRP